jgi:hypothetical protein
MAIIRKNKTSVGSSLPRNPKDKDLAVNSLTGEIKVYSKATNTWSLIGDGTGESGIPTPEMNNDGQFLRYSGQSDSFVWNNVPTPDSNFTSTFIGSSALNNTSYYDNINSELYLHSLIIGETSVSSADKNHFVINCGTKKIDYAVFDADSLYPFYDYGAEFRITLLSTGGGGTRVISVAPPYIFTRAGESSLDSEITRNFKVVSAVYSGSSNEPVLLVW